MTEQPAHPNTFAASLPHYDLVAFCPSPRASFLQRPQQLLSRFAREGHRVFYIEPPLFDAVPGAGSTRLEVHPQSPRVRRIVPHLPAGSRNELTLRTLRRMLGRFLQEHAVEHYVLWYSDPLAYSYSNQLKPRRVIYDHAPEDGSSDLLERADLVFTSDLRFFERRRDQQSHLHFFPNCIDLTHFAQARSSELPEPPEQARLPYPRIGFYGALDSSFDRGLVEHLADLRPNWQLILLGAEHSIDPSYLPHRPNIHYLGPKSLKEAPAHLRGWDVAMIPLVSADVAQTRAAPFAALMARACLAAGRPIISTAIREVIRPFAIEGLVHIASCASAWVMAIEEMLFSPGNRDAKWLDRVDQLLSRESWDHTVQGMRALVAESLGAENVSTENGSAKMRVEPLRALGE